MVPLSRETKDIRVVVKCPKSFVDRVNRAANDMFEGDRSRLVRTAVIDYLDRVVEDETRDLEAA